MTRRPRTTRRGVIRAGGIRRTVAVAAAMLVAGGLLSACSQSAPLPSVSYSSTDGDLKEFATPTRPVVFSGTTVSGSRFDSKDYVGKVLVVNFWYAGCGPCQREAPALEKLAKQYADSGVQFVGVNVRDPAGQAAPFQTTYKVSYPSILDSPNHSLVQYAFSAVLPPTATPTTMILTRTHGVLAYQVGQVTNTTTVGDLIQDALKAPA